MLVEVTRQENHNNDMYFISECLRLSAVLSLKEEAVFLFFLSSRASLTRSPKGL